MSEQTDLEGCTCKVGRLVDAWGLESAHRDLVSGWQTGSTSLRDGADQLNRAALRAALSLEADFAPLDGEVTNLYRLLTDAEVSEGMRVQTKNRLERQGLDVEALQSSFVSYQTVNRHLHGCLNVERAETTELSIEEAEDRLYQLRARLETVGESTLRQLDRSDQLTVPDPEIFVDVRVSCANCGVQYSLTRLFEEGGCDCTEV